MLSKLSEVDVEGDVPPLAGEGDVPPLGCEGDVPPIYVPGLLSEDLRLNNVRAVAVLDLL